LLEAGADIVGVLYLDESKSGVTVAHCSFDDLVRDYRLNARPFTTLHDPDILSWMQKCRPEVGMVIGVSQLIGKELLAAPRQGFIGMHPTLLPEGRGRAPIPWTLIKGLQRTGVSLFWCDPEADTGKLLLQASLPVYYEDTAAILGARTDEVAARLLVESLPLLASGHPPRIPQDDSKATVWGRRRPEDGVIDWTWPKRRIYDWVRALTHPYPGAFTCADDYRLYVWSCRESQDERRAVPGTVLEILPHGVLVACGDGAVLLSGFQWENQVEVDAKKVGLTAGQRLGNTP
jgi:methionyl-tRNA formyltransferase